MNKWKRLIAIAAVIGITQLIAPDANAQFGGNKRNPNRPASADQEYKYEKLTAPVQFPNVPPYTGRTKFVSGLKYPNDKGGPRIGMTFLVQEDQAQVLDWYRQSLKIYQWKVIEMPAQPNLITAASRDGTLSVRVGPTHTPGYRSEVIISHQSK